MSVTIDQKIYQKAHELGINVSKVSENALINLIEAIETHNNPNKPFSLSSGSLFGKRESEVRSPGFEPGIISLEGPSFERWRKYVDEKKFRGSYATTIFNLGLKYGHCITDGDLSAVKALPETQRPNVLKALANWSKCFGYRDVFGQMLEANGVGWVGKSKNQVFASRLSGVRDPEAVWSWVRDVKQARPELEVFMDFNTISGLRFVEAVDSYNLIGVLSRSEGVELQLSEDRKSRISGYFNSGVGWLEHFWFSDMFLRSSKNAFVSFVPADLVKRIAEMPALAGVGPVQKLVHKRGLPVQFKMLRKAHGSFMLKYLKKEEVDFIHGRVTGDVFMANYMTPVFCEGLKARAFQGIAEIQGKVKV